jgi:hypothetical protein
MSNANFYNKYIKYKTKYKNLKMHGGVIDPYIIINNEFRIFDPTIAVNASGIDIKVRCNDITIIDVFVSLYAKKMYIASLKTCSLMTGTQSLNKLINIARNLKLEKIELLDVSTIYFNKQKDINCMIDMKTLYILVNGMSWYNKFGFVSENYNVEADNNDAVGKMMLKDFVELIVESEKRKQLDMIKEDMVRLRLFKEGKFETESVLLRTRLEFILEDYERKNIEDYEKDQIKKINNELDYNAFLNKFKSLFECSDSDIIKDVMKRINDLYIRSDTIINCIGEKATMIKQLLKYAANIITYSKVLVLKL